MTACPVTNQTAPTFTDANGCPHPSATSSQRAGVRGPLLLQDFALIDALSHFDRERIPERVVHAKGHGAHGVWETTEDVSDLCCAKFLEKGKQSPVVARFSTVGGESGSSDSARDPRGFSLKVKTEEGNWDFVGNNTPVFFLNAPAKFPLFIHTQKRNPATNLKDADAFWDYLSLNPESIHQVMILFSDRGTPNGYTHMNGYAGHAFKWITADGGWNYVQLVFKTDQGISNYMNDEAAAMDSSNPDSAGAGLVDDIKKGNFPSWTAYVQVMSPEQAKEFRYDVLDLTKVWPQKDFPLRKIGKFTLNRNVENYFAEMEQVAFAPSHLVPGIEPSNDPVLQSRLFSYPDTHRHRLGPNYQQIPINCPYAPVTNFQRSGLMTVNGGGGSTPNYPASLSGLSYASRPYDISQISDEHEGRSGVSVFNPEVTDLDFEQPRALWEKVFDDGQKERYVQNVVGHMSAVTRPEIVERQIGVFTRVSRDLGDRIRKAMKA